MAKRVFGFISRGCDGEVEISETKGGWRTMRDKSDNWQVQVTL